MGEVRSGGRGLQCDRVGRINGLSSDGADTRSLPDLPIKRGRGTPKKEDKKGGGDDTGRIERFLAGRTESNASAGEIFGARSKLHHTPVKKINEEREKNISENAMRRNGEASLDEAARVNREENRKDENENEIATRRNQDEDRKNSRKESMAMCIEGYVQNEKDGKVTEIESPDDSWSGSDREEVEREYAKHWFLEIRKAEARLRQQTSQGLRKLKEELEEKIREQQTKWCKEMFLNETENIFKRCIGEMMEEAREEGRNNQGIEEERRSAEDKEDCARCEQGQQEINHLRQEICDLKVNMAAERKQWEEERDKLLRVDEWRSIERNRVPNDVQPAVRGFDVHHRTKTRQEDPRRTTENRRSTRIEDARSLQNEMVQIMRRKPKPINERDEREEKGRRQHRKNNVSISFPEEEKGYSKAEVREKVSRVCKSDIREKARLRYESRGLVVLRCQSWRDKKEIMDRKRELRSTKIWIKDDLTRREKEVQRWLSDVADHERRKGRPAEVKYMKIYFGDRWWCWSDRRGDIEPWRRGGGEKAFFRDVGQQFRARG